MIVTFNTDAELATSDRDVRLQLYNGFNATLIRELGDEDRDIETGPMFTIEFANGDRTDAFIYEIRTLDGQMVESATLDYDVERCEWFRKDD